MVFCSTVLGGSSHASERGKAMKWLSSKTIWGGVGLIALGVYHLTQGEVGEGARNILEGLTAIGIRHGVWKAQG